MGKVPSPHASVYCIVPAAEFDDDWLHGPIDSGVSFYVKVSTPVHCC